MPPQNTGIYTGSGPKATAGSVIQLYWQGMRKYRFPFLFALLAVALSAVLQVYIPTFYKKFFDVLTTTPDKSLASSQLIGIIFSILLFNFFYWLLIRSATLAQNFFQSRIMAQLRQNAFNYMLEHSYTFFANNFTGSLTQRVNRFARAFDTLADRFLWSIIPLSINVIGIVIVVWKISPIISCVIIGWVVGLGIFNYFFSIWKVKYDIANAALDSKSTAVLSDAITNQNTIQQFTGYQYEVGMYRDVTNAQAKATTFSWNMSAIVEAVQSSFIIIAEFLLFFFAIKLWVAGRITVGSFVLIQAYFIGLGSRLWELTRIIRMIYESFADAKEMADIMLVPHEIKDKPQAHDLVVTQGEITFKDLEFRFNETRTVLNKINLDVAPREKIALIGPSGAGKSTFVRLILRLYEPTSGEILIDNQNVQDVTQESLRHNISFVPQDPVLFHRSLKDNIRYGRRDATDEEVYEAARLAHCHEFIKELPLGYDTHVGERGIKLSGGERQRVAIARAILKNAPILILDEATSSLDSESEHLIQDALDTLMKGKTVIVIAHRLSTIRKMDRIIVINEGNIIEQGTHEELLENAHSLYRRLWDLQAGGFLKDDDELKTEEKSGVEV